MLSVDDDEFIALSDQNWDYFALEDNESADMADTVPKKREKKQRKRLVRSLFNYAQWVFHANKEFAALRFQPILKHQCWEDPNSRSSLAARTTPVPPRVGRWPASEVGKVFEGKLLLRTDSVQNFYIHHISQLLHPSRHRNSSANSQKSPRKHREISNHHIKMEPLDVGINEAAVLHYKLPFNESGDIFSNRRTAVATAACDAHRRWTASALSAQRKHENADGVLGATNNVDRTVVTELPPLLQTKLNENYRSRLKRNDEPR